MTQICLVRHGQTEWNLLGKLQGQTDIPLNETGKFQAEECREYLKDVNWDALITTSLKRARQTAEIINKELHLPIIVMDHFIERYFGVGEGMIRRKREKEYPDFIFPEMESQDDLFKRIDEGLKVVNQEFHNHKVLIVAHGAVINAILSRFHKGKLDSIKLFNGCLTNIQFEHNEWKVHDFNFVNHLSEHKDKNIQAPPLKDF
ncbi:histidine phosphatase family protein [Rossellomorea aquimaris]|uniref:histidine phosphatase family protein n=1 Tax=Rossellomorea aquimaris TaxID=189382 RepID=UPI0007D06E9D|nr:histidine phosphatase family protein [Rossellomorea aquimaris]